VVMEQSRKVTGKSGEERNMDFGTVFLQKNGKNVSCILLEKGLLRSTVSKSGDNASKFLEDLLAAEKVATDKKVGVHSPNPAPIRVFHDLTNNPKAAKGFEVMVMKRPNRKLNGVVEYCFSGMRFKVRLDSENTAISFSVLGVKTMSNDKNQPQQLELSNEAQAFAREMLLQKDVVVDLDFADKRGTFFGQLALKNKSDYGLMLVQEGLAQVSVFGSKAPANIDDLEDAEHAAKEEGRGIWALVG
jgi:endonuclease YncB( thermonuclease family)